MTKRRGRRRSESDGGGNGHGARPDAREIRIAERAEELLNKSRPQKAVELLESALEDRPDSGLLLVMLSHAREEVGDPWGALAAAEDAFAHSEDPQVALRLVGLYVQRHLLTHALQLLRSLEPSGLSADSRDTVRQSLALLREDLAEHAEKVGLPKKEAERGLLLFERGRRALVTGDYAACIEANRQAIQVYGDWPSPRNNLTMALLTHGQPEEALEQIALSLESDPENVHALGLGVRYLTWFGREEEAREMWRHLETISPGDLEQRLQKAEAAAALLEHEALYRILRPTVTPSDHELAWGSLRAHELLAIAEANTGRRDRGRAHPEYVAPSSSLAREALRGLRAGDDGIGWADHYRYFDVLHLLPGHRTDEFLELTMRSVEDDPEGFRQDLRSFTEQYPQVVRIAEKTIWEEQMPSEGVELLWALGTDPAGDALERFAFSQVGPDEERMKALAALADMGRLDEVEESRFWVDGQWQYVSVSFDDEADQPDGRPTYSDEVADLLNRAADALQAGEADRAEKLFWRALELEPRAREAYNNLSTIYSSRGDWERAEEMLERAVEIDPLYAHAACNLASHRLDQDRIEEAEELLAPLSALDQMTPEARRLCDYVRARILIRRDQFDAGQKLLEEILDSWPDYEPARDILTRIRFLAQMERLVEDMKVRPRIQEERQAKRDRAWRQELQQTLTTLSPTLEQALPLYYKDGLQAVAEIWMPEGGWSQLRKAELVDDIIYAITEEDKIGWVVAGLPDEDLDALEAVVERGGVMAWDAFDEQFGNDLDESRHWREQTPETTMGWLRLNGLLVEATVDDQLYLVIPIDIREMVSELVRSLPRD